jgi:hypothetical protein
VEQHDAEHLHRMLSQARLPEDQHLFQLFGQDDWRNHSQANLHHGARAKIDEAVRQLSRRGPVPAPAHVVAELPFGFWVSLLGSGNSYHQRLWRTALYRAFPATTEGATPCTGVQRERVAFLKHMRVRQSQHGCGHSRHIPFLAGDRHGRLPAGEPVAHAPARPEMAGHGDGEQPHRLTRTGQDRLVDGGDEGAMLGGQPRRR